MSKHLTYSDWRYQIQDHDSSPNGCHPDCAACQAEESLEVLLHNDQPPTCPKCGTRMRELDSSTLHVEGVHVCKNAQCDFVCRFENDEEFDEQNEEEDDDHECCDHCSICVGNAFKDITEEFIRDIESVTVEHVDEVWPDLAATYRKAKQLLSNS